MLGVTLHACAELWLSKSCRLGDLHGYTAASGTCNHTSNAQSHDIIEVRKQGDDAQLWSVRDTAAGNLRKGRPDVRPLGQRGRVGGGWWAMCNVQRMHALGRRCGVRLMGGFLAFSPGLAQAWLHPQHRIRLAWRLLTGWRRPVDGIGRLRLI